MIGATAVVSGELPLVTAVSGERTDIMALNAVTTGVDREAYLRDGYLVLGSVLTEGELGDLRAESIAMCRGDLGTVEGAPRLADDAADADVLRRYLCIHFPHKLSPKFTALLSHPRVVETLVQVIGPMSRRCSRCCLSKPKVSPVRLGTKMSTSSPHVIVP